MAINQANAVLFGEVFGVFGKGAGGRDDSGLGTAGGDNPQHLPDHPDADLPGLPVLALDQDSLAAFEQHDIDTAVSPLGRIDDGVALTTKPLGNQQLEPAPVKLTDRVQAGLLIQCAFAPPLASGTEQGSD